MYISLSLFAEKYDKKFRFRIGIELYDSKANEKDKERFKRLLDIPLKDDLVYIEGGNNDGVFREIDEHDNTKVKDKKYKKVQVSYVAPDGLDDEELVGNLHEKADELMEYYNQVFKEKDEETMPADETTWYPLLVEYNPGLTKETWIELLENSEVFRGENLIAMACIFDNGGQGSCSGLAEKYKYDMTLWRTSCGYYLADRIASETGCPVMKNEKGDSVWFVIPFLYRKTVKGEKGSYIYRLRPELYEALKEFGIEKYLVYGEQPQDRPSSSNKDDSDMFVDTSLSTREVIDRIKEYIRIEGFEYDDGTIENYYLSLKTKPFVILAGTSGTGKTKLVKLFAEAIGAKYKIVSVRPDWSDSSDLFGHTNLHGKLVDKDVTEYVKDAEANKDMLFCFID